MWFTLFAENLSLPPSLSPRHPSSTLFPLSLAAEPPLSARSTSSPPRPTNGGTGDIITHTGPRLLHLSHSSSLSFVLVASGGRAGFKYHRGSIETRVSTCLLDHACYVTRNAVPVPSIDRTMWLIVSKRNFSRLHLIRKRVTRRRLLDNFRFQLDFVLISSLKSFFKMNSNTFYVYFLLFPSGYNFEQYFVLVAKFYQKYIWTLSFDECRMQRNDFGRWNVFVEKLTKKKKETCYLIRVVINVNVQFKTTIY